MESPLNQVRVEGQVALTSLFTSVAGAVVRFELHLVEAFDRVAELLLFLLSHDRCQQHNIINIVIIIISRSESCSENSSHTSYMYELRALTELSHGLVRKPDSS